jgi:hypothetical protein
MYLHARTHSCLRRELPLRLRLSVGSVTEPADQGVVPSYPAPAEDGGVGAPPPAGRAERRHHLDLILSQLNLSTAHQTVFPTSVIGLVRNGPAHEASASQASPI